MDCEAALDLVTTAAARGVAVTVDVEAHLTGCAGCRREAEPLLAAGRALDRLTLLEPSARGTRALRRRIMRERLREPLTSSERWAAAALVASMAAVASMLVECALPYDVLAAACEALVSRVLPTSTAYVLAGIVYSIVPICLVTFAQARRRVTDAVDLIATPAVFVAVLGVYAVLSCGDFPWAFLAGLVTGIAVGAFAGAAAGTRLGRQAAYR